MPYPITRDKLVPGLVPGVKLDIFFPGFPTLKHVSHTAKLEKRGVRVFQAASRDDNMCLAVQPKPDVIKVCVCVRVCLCDSEISLDA